MKTPLLMLIVPVIFMLAGMQRAEAGKTADNLLAAYKGEYAASLRYAAFAEQARKEGFPQIAILFTAASRSEDVHAANHKTVLGKMGMAVPDYKPEITVATTKENLGSAIRGESNEVQDLYPGFITLAKQENETNAVRSMRWAMETEKRHTIFFQNATAALNGKYLDTLPKLYWVCPKCGNTYDVPSPEGMCSFCGTANNKFIKINR